MSDVGAVLFAASIVIGVIMISRSYIRDLTAIEHKHIERMQADWEKLVKSAMEPPPAQTPPRPKHLALLPPVDERGDA